MNTHFTRRAVISAIIASAAVFVAWPQQAWAHDEASTFELDQTRRAQAEAQAANRALADRLAALEARTRPRG